MNTEFYKNGKDIFRVEFLGFEIVRITNMRLAITGMYKPVIESQHNFVTEVLSGHLTKISASEVQYQ